MKKVAKQKSLGVRMLLFYFIFNQEGIQTLEKWPRMLCRVCTLGHSTHNWTSCQAPVLTRPSLHKGLDQTNSGGSFWPNMTPRFRLISVF